MRPIDPEHGPQDVEPGSPEFMRELQVDASMDVEAHGATELIDRSEHQAASSGALVIADDLVAGYLPGVNILTGCDFYAHEGEMVGIIGPNGAGKSTLLKAMFGLVKISSGQVTLRGDEVTNLRADKLVKLGVGFVPQTNNVFPSLTIEENMQMGGYQEPDKVPERFAKVADIFPALADRRRQRAGTLSGGERQMVAMGRALMMEPSVLLLDEPSAGSRRNCRTRSSSGSRPSTPQA